MKYGHEKIYGKVVRDTKWDREQAYQNALSSLRRFREVEREHGTSKTFRTADEAVVALEKLSISRLV